MGVEQLSSSSATLYFKVTGTLTLGEVSWLQSKAVAGIKRWGKVRALVTLEDFQGWKKGPGWDDMSFSNQHDQDIEKMAIVGPEEWRDWACAFAGKGLIDLPWPFRRTYFLIKSSNASNPEKLAELVAR